MNLRNLVIWGVIVVVLIGLYSMMTGGGRAAGVAEIPYSEMLSRVSSGEVKEATIGAGAVEVKDQQGKTLTAVTPSNQDKLIDRLEAQGVKYTIKRAGGFTLLGFIVQSLPILLLIGVWIFFMRQMQGGARGAMGFGK